MQKHNAWNFNFQYYQQEFSASNHCPKDIILIFCLTFMICVCVEFHLPLLSSPLPHLPNSIFFSGQTLIMLLPTLSLCLWSRVFSYYIETNTIIVAQSAFDGCPCLTPRLLTQQYVVPSQLSHCNPPSSLWLVVALARPLRCLLVPTPCLVLVTPSPPGWPCCLHTPLPRLVLSPLHCLVPPRLVLVASPCRRPSAAWLASSCSILAGNLSWSKNLE
jgi:hypothetical protein